MAEPESVADVAYTPPAALADADPEPAAEPQPAAELNIPEAHADTWLGETLRDIHERLLKLEGH